MLNIVIAFMDTASAPGNGKGEARPPTNSLPDHRPTLIQQADEILAPHRARFDALLSVVAVEHGLAPAQFIGPNKLKRFRAAKREAVQLAIECLVPPLNVEVIGLFFGLSRSAIYRLDLEARKLMRSDAVFAARLERLRPRVREALAEVTTPLNGENHHA